MGIRGKLIAIFVVIKVFPLLLLGWLAWDQARALGEAVSAQGNQMAIGMRETVLDVGKLAIADSVKALDEKSRETIERLTTDTARRVADFLYQRDDDIRLAATLPMTEEAFKAFLGNRMGKLTRHSKWELNGDQSKWVAEASSDPKLTVVKAEIEENKTGFHYRQPELAKPNTSKPLFLEMTFIDLEGQEQVKVTTSAQMDRARRHVSDQKQTWLKAENYFQSLSGLRKGEIYVSDVIGAYQPSKVIGAYTPAAAKKAGVDFAPKSSAYAGKENPVGRRFKGLVRWAMPVFKNDVKVGYVTLALDHDHIMEFSDHILPTEERYTAISDASSGNYAFMWDYEGRNISHPRDYFVVGFDPETGEREVPWLSRTIYKKWKESGKAWGEFEKEAPRYLNPGNGSKPSMELRKQGRIALDCRFLNFAPQCAGWHNLTRQGGSGSFLIFWSGLWKLTTAATIPYTTGRYGESPRGFGYVTIGANVDEFHKAATETGKRLNILISNQEKIADRQQRDMASSVSMSLAKNTKELSLYTLAMVIIVIAVAVWMASFLSGRLKSIVQGIHRFQKGDLSARLDVSSEDELGQLSGAFNKMAGDLEVMVDRHLHARHEAEESNRAKSEFLANMSHELRTPLNAILGFSDVIRQQMFGPLENPRYLSYAEDIHQSGSHLLDIINDILDLTRISAGHDDMVEEEVDLSDAIDKSVQMITGRAKKAGIHLKVDVEAMLPKVSGDKRRVKQMILNLLSNSIKFTHEGGRVKVAAKRVEGGEVAITVSDTGIGMTEVGIENALRLFGQVDSGMEKKYQGSGIGLPLTKSFIESHGGGLAIESTLGKGTTATLYFPKERVMVVG